VRPRLHRQNLVVWESSARPAGRYGTPRFSPLARTRRIRWWIRTGAQLAVIGLMRLARAMRARRGVRLLLTGAAITVAGMMVPNGVISLAGMLVFLRGVAVTLGVSERHRRLDGGPAAAADYFGFGSLPPSESRGRRARVITGQS
jgi:hypothetical protein